MRLKRLYVDNYRCLENFEMHFDSLSLFSGANGSGKTAVFDVLAKLQAFVWLQDNSVKALFSPFTRTRWKKSDFQRFELETECSDGSNYLYSLTICNPDQPKESRVVTEKLSVDGKPLFELDEKGEGHLYKDSGQKGPSFPFNWRNSGLGFIVPGESNKKLTHFKTEIAKWLIGFINPWNMSFFSEKKSSHPSADFSNFVSWYSFLSHQHAATFYKVMPYLEEAIPGFEGFNVVQTGETQSVLKAKFKGTEEPYWFHDLSEGQKVLSVLYVILEGLKGLGYSIFLDEPDNFLSAKEIQPWFSLVEEFVEDGFLSQATFISHHPEALDYLGVRDMVWFEREAEGPTRFRKNVFHDSELTPSELVARDLV